MATTVWAPRVVVVGMVMGTLKLPDALAVVVANGTSAAAAGSRLTVTLLLGEQPCPVTWIVPPGVTVVADS